MTVNLIPNPSAGADLSGGWNNGTRVTALTGFPRTTGVQGSTAGAFIVGPRASITPGASYVFSVTARPPVTGLVQVFVDFFNASGTNLGSGGGNVEFSETVPANTVARLRECIRQLIFR